MPEIPVRVRWTGEIVGDTLKRMSRNKAPGLDEWRVYEMRAWRIHIHEAATLLEEVEHTGKWPIELGDPWGYCWREEGRRTRWIGDPSG